MIKTMDEFNEQLAALGVVINGKTLVHTPTGKILKAKWMNIEEIATDLKTFHRLDATSELLETLLFAVKESLKELK